MRPFLKWLFLKSKMHQLEVRRVTLSVRKLWHDQTPDAPFDPSSHMAGTVLTVYQACCVLLQENVC